MQSTGARLGLAVVAIGAAVVLFVVLSGDDDEGGSETTPTATATAPAIQAIVVRDGEPVGSVKKLSFKKGERIRFTVETDGGESVHLHGYNVEKPVPSGGGRVSFDVPADLEGVYEVELHGHEGESQIAEITVEP